MASSPSESPVGYLVPLNKKLEVDNSFQRIPVLPGNDNVVGRGQLPVIDKRVSRKQIRLCASSDGKTELVVEGQNPIIFFSGGQRKKICAGERVHINHNDIIELIPGSFSFKYVEPDKQNNFLSSRRKAMPAGKVKRAVDEVASTAKRNCRICPDEASSRTSEHEDKHGMSVGEGYLDATLQASLVNLSQDGAEPIRHFRVSNDILHLLFRLMRVQGLPNWANTSSVSIEDVIQGDVLVAILSNYMVDLEWLLSACPALKVVPHVLVVHGESGARTDYLKKKKPANWVLHKPPLPISYGTHHSKAMILIYPKGVRVIVHTANLIYVDWNNKSQGLWMQDFPWKDQYSQKHSSPFENDLIDYLSTLKFPEFKVNLPSIGNVSINASFFKKFDYSTAVVRLIASVPGYHLGSSLKKWGHMKLRTVLEECIFDKEFCRSPLVYQFSSLGSLDEKWLAELALSMSAGFTEDKAPLGLGKPLIIWPTVEDVRCSLEGYAAGNAIPSPEKNVEKEFLKKYWAKWKASHTGRCRAMPHIKSYTRYHGQKLAWFLLTSANLSKAAWGSLQKNNSQIMIRSYELGVLFLPVSIHRCRPVFSCTEDCSPSQDEQRPSVNEDKYKLTLTTLCRPQNKMADESSEVISLPVPYEIPPKPYTAEDVPWSWDRRYTKKDVYGEVWPRHVQLYMEEG